MTSPTHKPKDNPDAPLSDHCRHHPRRGAHADRRLGRRLLDLDHTPMPANPQDSDQPVRGCVHCGMAAEWRLDADGVKRCYHIASGIPRCSEYFAEV